MVLMDWQCGNSGTLTSKNIGSSFLMTTQGFKFIEVIFERIGKTYSRMTANPLMALLYFSLGMLIFFSLCFIGIHRITTPYLEFYIVAVLSLMMIPFGTNKKYIFFMAQRLGMLYSLLELN